MTGATGEPEATTVRCPMPECRRRIDLEALLTNTAGGALSEAAEEARCLHFITARGGQRGRLSFGLLHALDGNRELAIRNVRPPDFDRAVVERFEHEALTIAARFGRVVDDVALFGDQYDRDAMARELAQLLIGPDPMVHRMANA